MMRFRASVPHRRQSQAVVIASLVYGLLLPLATSATEVKRFRADRREAFLEGTLRGVAVDPLGALSLATRIERLTPLEEPFAYTAAPHPDGWVVGTGPAGRVLLVDRKGAVRTLFETPEPNIFALWVDPKGTVYAASSPNGAVYRLAAGAPAEALETVFDPDAVYVWKLLGARDGSLLVATGLPGRLYRLDRHGEPELLIDAGDRHVRSVVALDNATLLAGTAGHGRILERRPNGSIRTLYDGAQPEVVDLALAADGAVFAALLASESSQVDLSSKARTESKDSGSGETPAVEVSTQSQATVGSRPAGASGARSLLLRIAPRGAIEQVWSEDEDTVHSLLWQGGNLWLGTGEEGRLYRLSGRRMVLEHDLEARQITAIVPAAPDTPQAPPVLLTTNDAAVHVLGTGPAAEGTYTSEVLDAGAAADFGTLGWHGEQPPGTRIDLALRTGMAQSPDGTWSEWTTVEEHGQEAALGSLPAGRYVQWRATFHGTAKASPRLVWAELSYRQRNQPPVITTFEALDPGQILVPSSFNPQNQVFEPWSPNRDGIFTSLKNSVSDDSGRLKPLWKRGYRTLRWEASDGNEESLRYTLEFRPAGDRAQPAHWLKMAEDIEETFFSFDATVLPDGVYRFRLTVSDEDAQPDHLGLEAQASSPPVVVDHTPPALVHVTHRDGEANTLEVVVRDDISPLRDAVYSADGGAWTPALATDGLVDGRSETLRIKAPRGVQLLLLRIMDAGFNVVTFNLLVAQGLP